MTPFIRLLAGLTAALILNVAAEVHRTMPGTAWSLVLVGLAVSLYTAGYGHDLVSYGQSRRDGREVRNLKRRVRYLGAALVEQTRRREHAELRATFWQDAWARAPRQIGFTGRREHPPTTWTVRVPPAACEQPLLDHPTGTWPSPPAIDVEAEAS